MAFVKALEDCGYDRHGEPLSGQHLDTRTNSLHGSLDIYVDPNLIIQGFSAVQLEASQILSEVLKAIDAVNQRPRSSVYQDESQESSPALKLVWRKVESRSEAPLALHSSPSSEGVN